jgi:hypothetical protein
MGQYCSFFPKLPTHDVLSWLWTILSWSPSLRSFIPRVSLVRCQLIQVYQFPFLLCEGSSESCWCPYNPLLPAVTLLVESSISEGAKSFNMYCNVFLIVWWKLQLLTFLPLVRDSAWWSRIVSPCFLHTTTFTCFRSPCCCTLWEQVFQQPASVVKAWSLFFCFFH